jgi:hypothetical protein
MGVGGGWNSEVNRVENRKIALIMAISEDI